MEREILRKLLIQYSELSHFPVFQGLQGLISGGAQSRLSSESDIIDNQCIKLLIPHEVAADAPILSFCKAVLAEVELDGLRQTDAIFLGNHFADFLSSPKR